jgi:hypothetical protein
MGGLRYAALARRATALSDFITGTRFYHGKSRPFLDQGFRSRDRPAQIVDLPQLLLRRQIYRFYLGLAPYIIAAGQPIMGVQDHLDVVYGKSCAINVRVFSVRSLLKQNAHRWQVSRYLGWLADRLQGC